MVQVLTDPASPLHANHTAEEVWRPGNNDQEANTISSREEHAKRMRELAQKRGLMKKPKRGWSLTDYQGERDASHMVQAAAQAALQSSRPAPIPENTPLQSPAVLTPPLPTPTTPLEAAQPRRPRLPTPRRSYTVMDYEPLLVNLPRPSGKLTLLDLPSELHYQFFDFLDPIDGVCLGLAHSKLYAIHRRKYGKVPLSSRYSGPNDMEWAWRGAGHLLEKRDQHVSNDGKQKPKTAAPAAVAAQDLERMRVKGQVYCRKCGVSRCELSRHLRDWMGEEYEYCEIKQIYGRPAGPDAKSYCFMSSPKNPNRCGRHGSKKPVGSAAALLPPPPGERSTTASS